MTTMGTAQLAKRYLPTSSIQILRDIRASVLKRSVEAAIREQNLTELFIRLPSIVSDITDQYSTYKTDTPFLQTQVRALHAFQISLVQKAMEMAHHAGMGGPLTIVDIGDSSGTHVRYLKALFSDLNTHSINCDPLAVAKIKKLGLSAIHAQAEELEYHSIKADIYISFEMLEHLYSPVDFLRRLSETSGQLFVLTVPFLRQSRVGLHHIRNKRHATTSAETNHIFELSPQDWELLFQHSGWKIAYRYNYLQYPRFAAARLLKHLWRTTDFEGFFGVILVKDNQWKKLNADWFPSSEPPQILPASN